MEDSFEHIFEATEDIAIPKRTEIAHDQRADVTIQQLCNINTEHYFMRVIGNKELAYDAQYHHF